MSTIKVNTITDASGGSNVVLQGVASPPNGMGFRNRIINGDMRIDQRNAGAAVTLTSASSSYGLDRYLTVNATDGTITYQQVVDAPSDFYNSTKLTVTSADASLSASQNFRYIQRIEANNLADFNLGTASAKTFTVSFWVKSSLTGNFAFSVNNFNVADQSYVTTYTINSANTWEQKTITIPAPTTGTFNTGTNVGLEVLWGLGSGTTFNTATQNQWVAANVYSFLGAVSVVGTASATWFITGVQLEAGSVASPFERRDIGRELMMCQRYLPAFTNGGSNGYLAPVFIYSSTGAGATIPFQVPTRVKPTGVTINSFDLMVDGTANFNVSAAVFNTATPTSGSLTLTISGATAGQAGGLLCEASTNILFTGCEL